jgi:hypothetical protein
MGIASFFTGLFSSSAATVIKEVGDAIDKNVTSDEERGKIKLALQDSLQGFAVKMEEQVTAQEAEISKRWEVDVKSDSWLAKNVRPLFLVYVAALISIAGGFALAGRNLPDAWLSLLSTITVTVIVAYFGGRTAEKGIGVWKNGKG